MLYFAGLGSAPLFDPDEPVYGVFVKTMVQSGDWTTPRFDGHIWYDKPPLFHWLAAFSSTIIGINEYAVRLPSAVLAVALTLLVFAWGTFEMGRLAGCLSALVMATCLQQIILGRAAVTDITLVFFLTLTVYAWRRGQCGEGFRVRLAWHLLAGIAAGLGMLTKGPVSLVLPGAAFLFFLIWKHGPLQAIRRIFSAETGWMLVASLVVGLPWFIISYNLHPDDFYHDMILVNHIQRFLRPEHPEQTGGWYSHLINIPILFVFFFPWSVFLPQSLVAFWKRRHENEGLVLASIYGITVLVFFSISKTILVTYIFPMFPAVALLTGAWLKNLSTSVDDEIVRRSVRRGLNAGMVMGSILTLGLAIAAWNKFPEALAVAPLGGIVLLATFFVARRQGTSLQTIPWIIGGGMVIFATVLAFLVLPIAGKRGSTRGLIAGIPHEARLATFRLNRPSMPFIKTPSVTFYGPPGLCNASDAIGLEAFMQTPGAAGPTFVLTRDSYVASVTAQFGGRQVGAEGGFGLVEITPAKE